MASFETASDDARYKVIPESSGPHTDRTTNKGLLPAFYCKSVYLQNIPTKLELLILTIPPSTIMLFVLFETSSHPHVARTFPPG